MISSFIDSILFWKKLFNAMATESGRGGGESEMG
jgi:hypothetical protein